MSEEEEIYMPPTADRHVTVRTVTLSKAPLRTGSIVVLQFDMKADLLIMLYDCHTKAGASLLYQLVLASKAAETQFVCSVQKIPQTTSEFTSLS